MTEPVTNEELEALRAYAAKHGRTWKATLLSVWAGNAPYDDAGILRRIRNRRGPSWLVNYRLPRDV